MVSDAQVRKLMKELSKDGRMRIGRIGAIFAPSAEYGLGRIRAVDGRAERERLHDRLGVAPWAPPRGLVGPVWRWLPCSEHTSPCLPSHGVAGGGQAGKITRRGAALQRRCGLRAN